MERKIIDVSKHNGKIDWAKVKAAGIEGAILRCGYGSDMTSQDDAKWKYNADECTRLGIPFGVYLYSYAKTEAESRSEAAHVLRLIKGYKLSYPVYLDLEQSGTESHAVKGAKIFCDIIEKAGYSVGIYANQYWFTTVIKNALDKYTKWCAKYSKTKPSVTCDIWQYSSTGKVNGISGNVDMNICYRDFPAEITGGPSKNRKFVGKVTADVLNVRTGAGTKYPNLAAYKKLLKGNLVDVCDTAKAADGSDWYYICIAKKHYGYVHSAYVTKA